MTLGSNVSIGYVEQISSYRDDFNSEMYMLFIIFHHIHYYSIWNKLLLLEKRIL